MTFSSLESLEVALDSARATPKLLFQFRESKGLPFRWHPLGFISCTLLVQGSKKARLHYWPSKVARPQDADCQIHDHIFDFSSWVLAGAVKNVEYEINEDGKPYSFYTTEYRGETSILTKTPRTAQLTISSSSAYSAGSKYLVEAGRLHETRRIGTGSALTVLITDDVSRQPPTVIGPCNGKLRYEYTRSVLSDSELREALTGL
jgi:hypothetical protein